MFNLLLRFLSDKIAELTTQNAILIAQLNGAQNNNEKRFLIKKNAEKLHLCVFVGDNVYDMPIGSTHIHN
jgi:hypothetical protein